MRSGVRAPPRPQKTRSLEEASFCVGFEYCAEAIGTLRQGEDRLPGSIRGLVVAAVGRAIACTRKGKGVDLDPGLRCSSRILDVHRHRFGDGHALAHAAGQRAVVRRTAPELRAVEVRPKAIGTLRQGKGRLPVFICRAMIASVSGSVESVYNAK